MKKLFVEECHWPELKTILDEEISKSKKFLDTYIC
jgi:hypothetical protein